MLKTQKQQVTFWRTLSYLFLTLLSAMMIFPFVWMLVTSFKPFAEIFSGRTFFPTEWTLDAYRSLFTQNDALLKVWNSFYIATLRTALSVFLCALGGYAFAKFRFPGRNVLFTSMIASMTIPFAVLLVPLFIMMRNYGWIDTAWPLIVPFAANAFGIFFMRQYMLSVSEDMLDAARIDGASELGIFMRVVLPTTLPGLASLGIIFFMQSWNDFLWPLAVLRSRDMQTVPLMINSLQGEPGRTAYDVIMAGSVVSLIPMLIIFLFLQRYLVAGITAGSVKG